MTSAGVRTSGSARREHVVQQAGEHLDDVDLLALLERVEEIGQQATSRAGVAEADSEVDVEPEDRQAVLRRRRLGLVGEPGRGLEVTGLQCVAGLGDRVPEAAGLGDRLVDAAGGERVDGPGEVALRRGVGRDELAVPGL